MTGLWKELWDAGVTPWDQGGAHPLLPELLSEARDYKLLPDGARILEPGCGRAHNGAALARLGYDVTACDLEPEAIAAARRIYASEPRLQLLVADALSPPSEWRDSFDAIFDRAFLCALAEEPRQIYVQACFDVLRPGGVLLSLPFTEVDHTETGGKGPPFAVPMPALSELLSPLFSVVHAEERAVDASRGTIRREMIAVWRRRARPLAERP